MKILSTHSLNTDIAALSLRLIFGGLFTYHGYDAIAHYHTYLAMSTDIIGIGTKLSFNLVVFSQFVCGLCIIIGFLTRLTVVPIFIAMSVAFFVAHAKDPFMVKELAFVYLLISIPVFILGSGKYSIDRLLFKK